MSPCCIHMTKCKQNASMIFSHCAAFHTCLSSCSDCNTYSPDESQLFLLQEKPEYSQFEPHARVKMVQVLGSPLYICSHYTTLESGTIAVTFFFFFFIIFSIKIAVTFYLISNCTYRYQARTKYKQIIKNMVSKWKKEKNTDLICWQSHKMFGYCSTVFSLFKEPWSCWCRIGDGFKGCKSLKRNNQSQYGHRWSLQFYCTCLFPSHGVEVQVNQNTKITKKSVILLYTII